ncbi:MAG: redoxin domain-containing protein [Candidatus Lambdaproteobacteria bacterium]|nr:redoxin domain-containing protein [Candidatus Lambdaproteobacteria bacterium]
MESRLKDIQGANAAVLGISADSPFSLAKWAEQEGYTFPLLSDFGKQTIGAYGVKYEDLLGIKGVPMRSVFIIDKGGKIVHTEVMDDARNLPDINALVDRIQTMA